MKGKCKHEIKEGFCSACDDVCSYYDKQDYELCETYEEEALPKKGLK